MGMQIGPLHVRRSALIEASPARVWQEFESEERIKGWLNLGHTIHRFEPVVGGLTEFSVEIDGEARYFGGKILLIDPEREITFESQWHPAQSQPIAHFWTIRLTPLYGGTLVEIFHHGLERDGLEAAENLEGYEGGWTNRHLIALRGIVTDDAA